MPLHSKTQEHACFASIMPRTTASCSTCSTPKHIPRFHSSSTRGGASSACFWRNARFSSIPSTRLHCILSTSRCTSFFTLHSHCLISLAINSCRMLLKSWSSFTLNQNLHKPAVKLLLKQQTLSRQEIRRSEDQPAITCSICDARPGQQLRTDAQGMKSFPLVLYRNTFYMLWCKTAKSA